ncbi:transcriptional regulator DEF1-like [Vicia villosa]|uniref:transcriptional regulator DEF1-like n=1 Tax=Vicia villosa TaxID=3911 RepID=UPI00273CB91A|nr:transcriptional regulator DEF1-like [Vicia villosa]
MNTSSFMDKQIMDLNLSHGSPAPSTNDFIDLIKHPRHHQQQQVLDEDDDDQQQHEEIDSSSTHNNGIKSADIVPSYDFQPIRSLPDSSPNFGSSFAKTWNSDSNSKKYSSLDSFEPAKVTVEKDRSAVDASILLEIDRTMKKHMDNLHHVLEGVSARLTQLETRTHHLESSMDDLKVSVGNNHGITDGKLRLLENILSEVQTGVQDIKDKQDIVQAQLQLAKLQVSKTEKQSEPQTSAVSNPVQQASSAPQQSQQYLPSSFNLPQSTPVVSPPNAPPQPPSQQGLPPPVQLPNQYSQIPNPTVPQRDPYLPPPPVHSQEIPNQQYQLPLTQQPHPQPGAPPHQQYQQTPHPQYAQPAHHLPQQQPPLSSGNPPQLQSSMGHHHLEEPSYVPSQSYPPNVRQPPSQPPSGPPPPAQQFYGTPPQGYESPSSRSGSSYSSGYGTLPGPAEPYRYGGPPQYGGKQPQLPNASVASSGGSGYPQLPTARPLPQAVPTASSVSGGSGSAGTGSRVSVDDVVEKVATMGFPRDHVRATVRKLTENGQSVDLNTVLDKLMNEGGGDMQQQRGWFGR